MKNSTKPQYWLLIMSILITLCISCKDDKTDEDSQPFDPSKPIVVNEFFPEKGNANQQLVIYGDNFGNDISKINVTIGGKKAVVVGLNSQSLYCYVPQKAFQGDIEVSIVNDNGEKIAQAEAPKNFIYEKKRFVTSFIGETYENNTKWDEKDGAFNDCGGFTKMEWMVFDPLNKKHMYIAGNDKACRIVDFENEYVSTFVPGFSGNKPVMNFNNDGDLIVTHDQSSATQPGNHLFTRSSGFTQRTPLWNARGCRSAAVHPVNGECYYVFYNTGEIWRGDFTTMATEKIPFKLPNVNIRVFTVFHPEGKYAYFIISDRHIILRADYNETTKSLNQPYLVAGQNRGSGDSHGGFAEGVGNNARLNWPQQGVFVKNEDYVKVGPGDHYDFYFCDKSNNLIRILTPLGKVSTFAGTDTKAGYRDGDLRKEARFAAPAGIAYDEEKNIFYIGDTNNHRIRKIAFEEED